MQTKASSDSNTQATDEKPVCEERLEAPAAPDKPIRIRTNVRAGVKTRH